MFSDERGDAPKGYQPDEKPCIDAPNYNLRLFLLAIVSQTLQCLSNHFASGRPVSARGLPGSGAGQQGLNSAKLWHRIRGSRTGDLQGRRGSGITQRSAWVFARVQPGGE